MHLQNFIKIHQLVHKTLSINKISTSIKGHNSVENEQKILFNHPNLHLVNNNAYTKFDWIHKLIHQILRINKILTLIKGRNFAKIWPKILCIRYNMDLVFINAFIKIHPFVPKILRKNTFLHQSRAITLLFINDIQPICNPNPLLPGLNVHAKFEENW